jgi:hypothetical protein
MRLLAGIIDATDEAPLIGEAPARGTSVRIRGGDKLCNGMGAIQGHQLVPEIIRRGVQRDGERHRWRITPKPLDAGHDAARRDGDPAGADPTRSGQYVERLDGGVDIGQGLPHPHIHNMRDRTEAVTVQGVRSGTYLVHDLRGRAVPAQAHPAGGAERTADGAADLRAHAHSRATVAARPRGRLHGNRLDREAVAEPAEQLDGVTCVSLAFNRRVDRGEREPAGERITQRCRELANVTKLADERLPRGAAKLAGAPAPLAKLVHQSAQRLVVDRAECNRTHHSHGTEAGRRTTASGYPRLVRDVLGALLGVPATILVAGGLGLVGVTIYSRIFQTRREPIRWAHLGLGFVLFAVGVLLVGLEILLFGAGK